MKIRNLCALLLALMLLALAGCGQKEQPTQPENPDVPQEEEAVPVRLVCSNGSTTLRYGFNFGSVPRSLATLARQIWNACLSNVRMVRISLQMLFSGRASVKDLSGPVGIVHMMTETANRSSSFYYALLNMLSFGGLITVNLGVMNLLPIPGLDGARAVGVLLTALVEGITRRKVNPKYEGYIQSVGTLALFALLAVIMFKDVIQIFKG